MKQYIVDAFADKVFCGNQARALRPNQNKLKELKGLCIVVTAPYWCDRLGKEKLVCFQASERTGVLYAERKGDRIILSGKAVLYSQGNILE